MPGTKLIKYFFLKKRKNGFIILEAFIFWFKKREKNEGTLGGWGFTKPANIEGANDRS
jgi:hypothetical protein